MNPCSITKSLQISESVEVISLEDEIKIKFEKKKKKKTSRLMITFCIG